MKKLHFKPELRPYQVECIAAIRMALEETGRADIYAAVGSGKTIIFSKIASITEKTMVIVVPRLELVRQTREKLYSFGVHSGQWGGGIKSIKQITVATSQSIKSFPCKPSILVIDEAHMHQEAWRNIPHDFLIRFTGTPWNIQDWSPCFELPIAKLTSMGYLTSAVYKRPTNLDALIDVSRFKVITGDFSQSSMWREYKGKIKFHVGHALHHLEGRLHCIWICVNIEHAMLVHSLVPDSEIVTSKIKTKDLALARFRSGEVRHLISVSMINVGFDLPSIDAVVFMRATQSLELWVQSIGRGLRPHETKRDCLILDYGENVQRLGMVHQITGEKKPETFRTCTNCDFLYSKTLNTCPSCGDPYKYLCNYCMKLVSNECEQCPRLAKQHVYRDFIKNLVDPLFQEIKIKTMAMRLQIPAWRKMKLYCLWINGKLIQILPSSGGKSSLPALREIMAAYDQGSATAIISSRGSIKGVKTDKNLYMFLTQKHGVSIDCKYLP